MIYWLKLSGFVARLWLLFCNITVKSIRKLKYNSQSADCTKLNAPIQHGSVNTLVAVSIGHGLSNIFINKEFFQDIVLLC